MKYFLTLLLWIALFFHAYAQECTRTRKTWKALSQKQRRTYKGAVARAMKSGAFIKFVELHTEMMSEREAHNTCMFLYWHRLMLLAYENMLRAQGPQFACVTIPYFDYVTAFARFSSGMCNSIASCSAILTGLGGVPSGTPSQSVGINGVNTHGFCVNEDPLNNFCESSSACRSNRGVHCVPRGGWGQIGIPGSASFASVRNQVFQANNIAEVSSNIELGVHNNIHAALQGAMETFASPADPIFYSHHATVDLLHTIFHTCKVGTGKLTAEEKAHHPVAWNSCRRRDGGYFNPNDQVIMRIGEQGKNPTDACNDPQLAPFFKGVPTTYASLMDIKDLGSSSYQYEVSGLLVELTVCTGQNTNKERRLLMEAGTPVSVSNSTENKKICNGATVVKESNSSRPTSSSDDTIKTTRTPQTDCYTPVEITSAIVVANVRTEKAVNLTKNWLRKTEELIKQTVGETSNSTIEIEILQCMFQEECLGGIQEYSEIFKKNFGVTEPPRCRKILDDMKKKNQSVCKIGWRNVMEGYFGCPSKTIKTKRSPYTS